MRYTAPLGKPQFFSYNGSKFYPATRKRGSRSKDAFNILIYLLISNLKVNRKIQRPYFLACNFLFEQRIDPEKEGYEFTEESIGRQYNRLRPECLEKIYVRYQIQSCEIDPDAHKIIILREFPEWDQLIAQKSS